METSRRDLLVAGAALTALMPTAASAQPAGARKGSMEIIHVWAGPDGVSHAKRVTVTGLPRPLPVTEVRASFVAKGVEDWHVAPSKLFTINTAGDIIGEMSDGARIPIGKGDLVYLEDLTGKGHITRLVTDVSNLFLLVKPDFDFDAWAKG
ncbi:MAG: hypothetical protein J7494_04005 [Sphingobium sp.]|nr:hypothetical protein [Sphingobium sp.]